jgi:hypothetical protein
MSHTSKQTMIALALLCGVLGMARLQAAPEMTIYIDPREARVCTPLGLDDAPWDGAAIINWRRGLVFSEATLENPIPCKHGPDSSSAPW